ncbi:MAG TPA: ParB/RepB/Spo0J family partition protein [Thermomicrobiales bacterium]|nr:ParB/RepB/Spo0J family partition protein [Thermomicrobiales bacterium]
MSSRRRFTVDDLFTDTRPQAVGVSDLVDAKEIRLERIEPDPDQPRTTFDAEGLEELAASIRLEGVLQPIAVRYDAERDIYVIIHGERRWRAARLAGLETIPAIVRQVEGERVLLQQLMENIVREDLNALDRAQALRALKEQMNNAPWDQVAEAVGIRRSRLFQLLGTEKLSEQFRALLRDGVVSEKQTRAVQRLQEEVQDELARRVMAGSLAPPEVEAAARRVRDATSSQEAAALLDLAAAESSSEATRLHRATSRQARRLLLTINDLEGQPLASDLREELEALAKRIEQLLRPYR